METLTVVKDFDPLEDGGLGSGAGNELAAMDQFPFETTPEAFYRDASQVTERGLLSS